MTFNFRIAGPNSELVIQMALGSSTVFVGANGGGKTRLAVMIEETCGLMAHRISGHRSLAMNPSVTKISEKKALAGLRTGRDDIDERLDDRRGHRWNHDAAVQLLDDFRYVIQALFADQVNVTKEEYDKSVAGQRGTVKLTKMRQVELIWDSVLPHRVLRITGDDIQVSVVGKSEQYSASKMSDGERAVFYVIGQALLAAPDSMLIIDEPELHIHRSIMSKLWDEIEAARPDCAFVYITHDLEFAATRSAKKYVVHQFIYPDQWSVEPVPEETGFSEELTTLILGSRRPILFVEGTSDKLDAALYRCCFPDHTVIPRGSCDEVKHAVVSLRHNQIWTRVKCFGIVDADGLHEAEIDALCSLGVSVLPVSEIENLFLLPSVSRVIAEMEGYADTELEARLAELAELVFNSLRSEKAIEAVVVRYCRRRIDRLLKKLELGETDSLASLSAGYARATAMLDIDGIAATMHARIAAAIDAKNLPQLLALYDNKGLMSLAAGCLKKQRKDDFKNWLTRALCNDTDPRLREAIRAVLPQIGIS